MEDSVTFIPDMGVAGYSEFIVIFFRNTHEGSEVDVRYNGGGHVSQHLPLNLL